MSEIVVGQVYASTHVGDRERGERQRRRVVAVDGSFVVLQTLTTPAFKASGVQSRVRLRDTATGQRIPGHRLVEDAPACTCPPEMVAADRLGSRCPACWPVVA